MLLNWVRYALRGFRRDPAYALAAIVTLALASGASTLVFSVVHGVLLRPLPFRDPDRLIRIRMDAEGMKNGIALSAPELTDLRQRTTNFDGFAGFWSTPLSLGTGEQAMQVMVSPITANFFSLLGLTPYLGRDFRPGEDAEKAPYTAILSYELWRDRFGSNPNIIGEFIPLNEERFQVLGVMPPKLTLIGRGAPEPVIDLFIPQTLWTNRDLRFMRVIGRLKAGADLPQAQADLDSLSAQLRREYGYDAKGGLAMRVSSLLGDHVAPVRAALWTFLGAVAFVVLIACSTVASLLLARLKASEQEVAIKAALGASRAQILAQIVLEGVLLSAFAALLGLGVAALGLEALRTLKPANLPRLAEITLSLPVFLVAAGAAIVTGVICSVGPVWQTARLDLVHALRSGTRTSSGLASARLRSALIVGQMALTVVLLTGAGLLIRTALNLRHVELGFDSSSTVTFDVPVSVQRYGTGTQRNVVYQEIVRQANSLPGVRGAGGISMAPFKGGFFTSSYAYGPDALATWGTKSAEYRSVLPGYFETLRARLTAGRFFTWADSEPGPRRVIVDDSLARLAWPNDNPIGKTIYIPKADLAERDEPLQAEVIGVVRHLRVSTLRGEEVPQVYLAYGSGNDLMNSPLQMTIVARTTAAPATIEPHARKLAADAGTGRPVHTFRTLDENVARAMSDVSFAVQLMIVFAALALVLTAAGLYGVISYVVAQRRYEFGVRLALGARASQVISLVLRHGLILAAIGAALGLVCSALTTRFLQTLLFGIEPIDPSTLLSVSALLVAVAALACLVPAWRTASIDPARTMRAE